MELLQKLEQLKQMGNYSVDLQFGEGVGCDDSNVPVLQRSIKLLFYPVGCLGGVKIMFVGNVVELLNFDLRTKPIQISNPPKYEEYKKRGYYIWGVEDSVKHCLEKPFFGKWNERMTNQPLKEEDDITKKMDASR